MTPPMDYPVVKIGARDYVLKYSMLAKYRLSRKGIGEVELLGSISESVKAVIEAKAKGTVPNLPGDWLANVIDLWTVCAVHQGPGEPPTAEQWIAVIEPELENDKTLLGRIFWGLQSAIVKARRPSEAVPDGERPPAAPPN